MTTDQILYGSLGDFVRHLGNNHVRLYLHEEAIKFKEKC